MPSQLLKLAEPRALPVRLLPLNVAQSHLGYNYFSPPPMSMLGTLSLWGCEDGLYTDPCLYVSPHPGLYLCLSSPGSVLPAAAAVTPFAPALSSSSRSITPAATSLASSNRTSAARTGLSDTVCTAPSSSFSPEECQDDGFTLVTRTKRDRRRPPVPAQGNAPSSANRPSHPFRASRPSVGVSRVQRSHAAFPAFRVPTQEGFGTSYDSVAALEEEHSHLHMQNVIWRDGDTVLLPQDEDTYNTLHAVASDQGAFLAITELLPDSQLTKGIVIRYPLRMPPSLLRRHPQVEEATRCVTPQDKEETKQVLVSVRGPLPTQIDFRNWGVLYLHPYTPEPLRCFRYQRFGHHQANYSRPSVCGICSGRHETRQCLTRYKAKQVVTNKCPNCGEGHHALNPACPARQRRVVQGRVRQVQWVLDQQRATMSPAPPGTFVWGQQRSPPPPRQHRSAANPTRLSSSGANCLTVSVLPAPSTISERCKPFRFCLASSCSSSGIHRFEQNRGEGDTAGRRTHSSTPPGTSATSSLSQSESTSSFSSSHPEGNPPTSSPAHLRICQWNCRGFRRQLSSLLEVAQNDMVDIFMLQETWLSEKSTISFPGYRAFHRLRGRSAASGLLVLSRLPLDCREVPNPVSCGENIEVQAVSLHLPCITLLLYNVYRSPQASLDMHDLFQLAASDIVLAVGDFNAHHPWLLSPRPPNAAGRHLFTCHSDYGTFQLANDVQCPIHILGG
ncbi:RNA-directed DNA polymerase from mobile element jockey [Portunus trituberculatus]|uniref:RNA-directed DNA polymerase from mobile element jockey n=1 Tax=Portunus trituberculatus TaxID=210409 RepID=A0A5B7F795_PORTR|nr:RNA-directed DNA polymerase from mobile element jockey [Portunus trituberculatus]